MNSRIATTNFGASSASPYDQEYYDKHIPGSARSASAVVPIVMEAIKPRSVLDVGCGTCVWLCEFLRCGVTSVLGVDGEYVDQSNLAVPKQFFRARDLSDGLFDLGRFDLATCLEVAEHLPGSCSSALVQSLVNSSEIVLFSAAIPGQGGLNHINEQWPSYWQWLFSSHGYEPVNLILPKIRDNREVDWFYRQNLIVFASKGALTLHPEWSSLCSAAGQSPLEWMHFSAARREETFRSVWKKFRRVVGLSLALKWPCVFRFIVALKGSSERDLNAQNNVELAHKP